MSEKTQDLRLVLTDDGPGRITVGMEEFFGFSFELAEDLEDLVALWEHKAAPKARRCEMPIR
ncbi:MAG: hypothetical protein QGG36_07520 [Pirellulaceae bacterium]|jgi:hypothetical protein|nr:hypothetical protein [Pirellulaceae bacterium]